MFLRRSDRGALLILSLVMVFIVAGISVSLLTISTVGARREASIEQKFRSREIAESALDMGLNDLRKATDGTDNDGDGTIDEGIDLETVPFGQFQASNVAQIEGQLGRLGTVNWTVNNDANGNGLPDIGEANVVPVTFQGGQYIVYTIFSEWDGLDNDSDGTVDNVEEAGSLTCVAQAQYNGIVSEARFSGVLTDTLGPPNPPLWTPAGAVGTGGPLTVTGNADILGSHGSVHANGYLDVKGAAIIEQTATSSGGLYVHKPSNVGGGLPAGSSTPAGWTSPSVGGGTEDPIYIPDVRPQNLKHLATHILTDTGQVIDNSTGTVIATGNYNGFSFGGDRWNLSGGSITADGTFYVEGDVHIAGGSSGGGGHGGGTVHSISLISTDNIHVSGNLNLQPHNPEKLWLVAGGDIKITGTPNQIHEGIILAREQIFVAGNPDVRGSMMGCDLDNAHSLATENKITGNMSVTYDNQINTSIPIVVPSNKYILNPTFSAYEER